LTGNQTREGRQSELRVVAEIKKKFGAKIDLDKSPFVILEIIRNFRHFDDDNGGGGGGGGPTVSPSTIAVGISPDAGEISNTDLMREILELRKSMKEIQKSAKEIRDKLS